MDIPFTVPGAEPSLLRAGPLDRALTRSAEPLGAAPAACLLLHGFTSQPEEMRFLAEDLHRRGYAVLNVRLAGHGTHPRDLTRTRWTDWLLSVEDGLAILHGVLERVVFIGQSMGGMIALTAAACYPVDGVVALSTPYAGFPPSQLLLVRFSSLFGMVARKRVDEHPELGERREANYPAYARYPVKILLELAKLQKAMQAALPQVKVPALVVHSRQDVGIGPNSLEEIYNHLGSTKKEKLWLDGFDHSVVRDEKRQVVFETVAKFVIEHIEIR